MDFFTSDQHFGHKNIITYCDRPFADVAEMDEAMITLWNTIVDEGDTVWHLGDFAYTIPMERVVAIASQLNGSVNWIEGNHDQVIPRALELGKLPRWTRMPLYVEREIAGQHIVMCHYAMRTWHHDLRGVWHLYGHSHAGLPPLGKSCDVGVDQWSFAPVPFPLLKQFMDEREIHDAPQFAGYCPQP